MIFRRATLYKINNMETAILDLIPQAGPPRGSDRLDRILDRANHALTKPVYTPIVFLRLSNTASKKDLVPLPRTKQSSRPKPSPKPSLL